MAKTSKLTSAPDDPYPNATWEVIYTDSFDRECPPSVEVTGTGLVPGLVELWARFLFETVQDGGGGFSHFQLYLAAPRRTIYIHGDFAIAQKLKDWTFDTTTTTPRGALEEADHAMLFALARAHARALSFDEVHGSDLGAPFVRAIFDIANVSGSRKLFLEELGTDTTSQLT